MDICMTCGTLAEYTKAWPDCPKGCGKMLHLGLCCGCHEEVAYVLDDDICKPEQLACSLCVQRARDKERARLY